MKENIVVKGQLKGYLSWPIVLSVFLVCGNIALFLVSRVGALVMIPFTVCYIGTAVWIYVYSHKRILGGLVEFSSEYAWIQKQLLTDMVIPYVTEEGKLCHTLIISPPGCGKTTLLRDLVRQISDGWETFPGYTVGVVDERSEIGGSYQGIPQNDVGIRTDVLDCCSKAEGMVMLLRSMAPQVIAVDEIGNYEDIRAIEMTLNSGCKLLATVHGSSIDEIRKKPLLERLMKEHVFERYIILQKETAGQIGKVQEIYDERGTCLYQRQRSVC